MKKNPEISLIQGAHETYVVRQDQGDIYHLPYKTKTFINSQLPSGRISSHSLDSQFAQI